MQQLPACSRYMEPCVCLNISKRPYCIYWYCFLTNTCLINSTSNSSLAMLSEPLEHTTDPNAPSHITAEPSACFTENRNNPQITPMHLPSQILWESRKLDLDPSPCNTEFIPILCPGTGICCPVSHCRIKFFNTAAWRLTSPWRCQSCKGHKGSAAAQ